MDRIMTYLLDRSIDVLLRLFFLLVESRGHIFVFLELLN